VGRLVVVSNRVTPITGRQAASAGGLAVGVLAALRDTGGLWFGWSGEVTEAARTGGAGGGAGNGPPPPRVFRTGKVSYGLIDLSEADYQGFYAGFANRTLWPLFHYRLDLTSFEHHWYATYRRVNQRFAEALRPLLKPDDVIWIHDYHLIPMAAELRRLGCENRIGFFLHIPFPAPEIYVSLPWHRQLAADLCSYDVVGFQTGTDVHQFKQYVELELNGTADWKGTVQALGRQLHVDAYPIGIDVADVTAMAVSAEAKRQSARLGASMANRQLIMGVDRLDYTKGIVERLRAFELLLQDYPNLRRQVTFMQISAPSREQVPEYLELREQVELLSGHLNGVYSEADWVPLRYINRSYTRRSLMGFFRLSRLGLVTPLRDGMNLVALEYVAAQDEQDPGVLVLSRFAGCAQQLDGALVVNPYDVHHLADTTHAGLAMTLDERQDRWRRMIQAVRHHDIIAWRDRFLARLEKLERVS
jgi:trehalose 6-phosphate synthase